MSRDICIFLRPFDARFVAAFVFALAADVSVHANPTGGSVLQGAANIISGSQMMINQSSSAAYINWQTFNIDSGESVTFNQPSSSSVSWNYISDPNASTINGVLNANGYVILQNPNGFTVGGSAAITAHGLILTTASTPPLNVFGSGAWSFDAPPPTAKIINYGRINITGGGSAYLIASDIINNGTIFAPGGDIGLYAGEKVLVSMSPDGRGLSAEVTLPKGSVDNEGRLVADAGSIAAQAQFVNQNGVVQANSVKDVNGTIELLASDEINLGANSLISARGDSRGNSAGGSVTIKSDKVFSDADGSTIDISGGTQNGNGGSVEISAPSMPALNSRIVGTAQTGSTGGTLLLDPDYIVLDQFGSDSVNVNGSSGSILADDNPGDTLYFNVNSAFVGLSQITLQAKYDITLDTGTKWNLSGSTGQTAGQLNLQAGGNIIFGDGSGISDANNWSVTLQAGYDFVNDVVQSGAGSIYLGNFNGVDSLNNSGFIQTALGSINLEAGQDVLVGSGSVTTIKGGSINVTAIGGNVDTGTSTGGFNYPDLITGLSALPYYTPFALTGFGVNLHINYNKSNLGGISTAGGGDVNITAGGDVTSFPTTTAVAGDPGSGAFGSQAGNVTINAGGSVYGNFVVMNGDGTINAGQNIGTAAGGQNVALSLANGSWNLNAQGDIYLQEVRNPNGVFGGTASGGKGPWDHYFDYSPSASVSLTAGDGVYITGYSLPRPNGAVPLILPPTLIVNAGAGGFNLQTPASSILLSDYDITLFPSALGELQITTTGGGSFSSMNSDGSAPTLLMSDSGNTQWYVANSGSQPFSETDHAAMPPELNNPHPVTLDISGNMNDVILQTDKKTQIHVDGDMVNCTFYGENLQSGDVTSINVGGQIFNAGSFNSTVLSQQLPTVPAQDLPPGMAQNWFTILLLAVDSSLLPDQSISGVSSSQLNQYLSNARMFPGIDFGSQLAYNADTKTLTSIGAMSLALLAAMEQGTLTLVRYGPDGNPVVDSSGHFVTDTIPWMPGANLSQIASLYSASQGAPALGVNNGAYVVGGTGEFDVTAGSISLGNSGGILSVGNGRVAGRNYSYLTPYISSGANIDVTAGILEMASSTIAALGGGGVTVRCNDENSDGISMDLGSQELLPFEAQIMNDNGQIGLGIYTTGGGDVKVTALGTINIDSSRIATFNGGNVFVQSDTGDVNAGSGGTIAVPVNVFSTIYGFPYEPFEYVYANGIVADTLAGLATSQGSISIQGASQKQLKQFFKQWKQNKGNSQIPGAAAVPGDITVVTPQGSIYASLGGILQESLSGALPPGPSITLTAGTPANGDWSSTAPPEYIGDIDLGDSGVIGGTINVKATGKISGLLISQQDANVTGQSLGSLTVLATGTANVSGSGGSGITIVGGQGVNVSGVGSGAILLGQNVSVNGGTAQSTLGSSATATSTSQSAAGQTSDQSQQQVALSGGDDDEKKKKRKTEIHRVGRVTVILSTAVPPK
ncbi:MAG TPA: filamentous hemagglutinin N-terminal domain-containing protein [Verrucomicrobiae bacterium]|nr:filamentous hemagglutinin N-terminal domain-containing protein [Verrucomicrobiae bacterium]